MPPSLAELIGARRNELVLVANKADLLPEGRRQGEIWRFPNAAGEAIAGLDPRERFTVEFLFRDDSVMRVHFEAGDFAAARAFLSLGPL